MVQAGIVGLANVGKSTLFNALLKKQVAASANYPFTTIEPNVGVVEVPDKKLGKLADIIARDSSSSTQIDKKGWIDGRPPIVPAAVRFVDIAGLVKGAHKGEGLGNQFLAHIREVDVVVFVLRDFKNPDIIKTGENPREDLEVLRDELLLKDLEAVDKRIDSMLRELRGAKDNDPGHVILKTLQLTKDLIGKGRWLADELASEDLEKIRDLQLLSTKKTIVVVNCDEFSVATSFAEASEVKKAGEDKGDLSSKENPFERLEKDSPLKDAIRICAKMEEELAGLSTDEQKDYLKEVGIEESGLSRLIKKAYDVLSLMSFYTAGPKEVRAWTIQKGSLCPQAAGVIHTDFERGFIAADIVPYDKFVESNGWKGTREKGFIRVIGKSEVMPEDVVVEFKFSV